MTWYNNVGKMAKSFSDFTGVSGLIQDMSTAGMQMASTQLRMLLRLAPLQCVLPLKVCFMQAKSPMKRVAQHAVALQMD